MEAKIDEPWTLHVSVKLVEMAPGVRVLVSERSYALNTICDLNNCRPQHGAEQSGRARTRRCRASCIAVDQLEASLDEVVTPANAAVASCD